MAEIRALGTRINVDIEAELRLFSWQHARWTGSKLIASSPFRKDNAPSFFVDLTSGGWADSGAYGTDFASGNFIKLLAYLRHESEEQTVEYLADKYGVIGEIKPGEPIRLPAPRLSPPRRRRIYTSLNVDITPAISPYLTSRGISDEAQIRLQVGYNKDILGYTAMPWHDGKGIIANVKYRNTRNKRFFYEANATPISELVYGLHIARKSDYAVIVEGEIDALSWLTAGIFAVAVGSASLTDKQAQLIVNSGFKRIYLGGDNDEQGRSLNDRAAKLLRGYAELFKINYGNEKDANDVLRHKGVKELRRIFEDAARIQAINFRLT